MVADSRTLPTDQARDLLAMVRQLSTERIAPRAAHWDQTGTFPSEAFTLLGQTGVMGLVYPQEWGGGEQPYEVYLQVLEELAAGSLAVALGLSVHVLSCFPVATFGTSAQRDELLPAMLSGHRLGAYCLSEPDAGSDAAALRTRAVPTPDGYLVTGTKAWITHAGVADHYVTMARTGGPGSTGISCLLVDADTPGITIGRAESKMGMNASPTATVSFDQAAVPGGRLIGDEGAGFRIALAALDGGRLGIAACAVGVAQAALDAAVEHARQRQQFGRRIGDFQGVSFMLADMAASIRAARALVLDAARRRDAGQDHSALAASAKLIATDTAMSVTTDAVQVLGAAGYMRDLPVERLMREAKVLQIVEGTNQVQRLVIARELLR